VNADYKIKKINGVRYYEHRLVWERERGLIPAGYHIHHKNKDKRDNRLENLELVEGRKHHSEHSLELGATLEHKERMRVNGNGAWARQPVLTLNCTVCGAEFQKKRHLSRGAAKYCSPPCRGRDYYLTKTRPRLDAERAAA
jgi:hypothetical protein